MPVTKCRYCGGSVNPSTHGLSLDNSPSGIDFRLKCKNSPTGKHVSVYAPPRCVYCGADTRDSTDGLWVQGGWGGSDNAHVCVYSPTKKHHLDDIHDNRRQSPENKTAVNDREDIQQERKLQERREEDRRREKKAEDERQRQEEEWEREREEQQRRREELKREREEAQRKLEAEIEYNKTHCFYCGEKGMLVEFYGKYFHEKCLEAFKNSENGKKWIKEKETEEEKERIADENSLKIFSVAKKYSNGLWKDEDIASLYLEFYGKKVDSYVDLFQSIDIDNFTLFIEKKLQKIKAAEKARKEQEEQELQKKEAEKQAKLEAEKKAKEEKEKGHFVARVKLPVFIAGAAATLFFKNTFVLSFASIWEGKFIPVIALAVLLALYRGMLKVFISSGYDLMHEEIQKGNKVSVFYKFIVYAGLALVTTAIHGGLLFLVMRVLLRLW